MSTPGRMTKPSPESQLQSPIRALMAGPGPRGHRLPFPRSPARGARNCLGVPRVLPGIRPQPYRSGQDREGASHRRRRGPGPRRPRRLRDDDPGGLRRLRLLRVGLLPRDGGGRDDRRVARHPDRRPPVHRPEGAPALRDRGAEEEMASPPGDRRADRGLRADRARSGLGRGFDQDDRGLRRKDRHLRVEREQALDLQRRVRRVLHGLRQGRPARGEGRAPPDHGLRRDEGPGRRRPREGRAQARPEGLLDGPDRAAERPRAGGECPRPAGSGLQDRRRGLKHRPHLARGRMPRGIEGR